MICARDNPVAERTVRYLSRIFAFQDHQTSVLLVHLEISLAQLCYWSQIQKTSQFKTPSTIFASNLLEEAVSSQSTSHYFLNTISNLSEQIISKLDSSSPQSDALVELLVMGKERATQWPFIRAHCRSEFVPIKAQPGPLGLSRH